ncbi:MAG: hypothetical protein R3Y32_08835 [Bacillota bacterium]
MRVFGKINLFLNVAKLGGDLAVFHDIQSVFAPCFDIYDEISVSVCEKSQAGVFFAVSENILKCGREDYIADYEKKVANLASFEDNTKKAMRLFFEKFGNQNIRVEIKKGIPFLAGMGGSSADAVGVLKCLCEMAGKSYSDVAKICDAVGSDLAGMWSGGVNFCWGRGENAVEIAENLGGYAVVCVPNFGISTREIFAKFDSDQSENAHFEYAKNKNYNFISEFPNLTNALEKSAFSAFPKMREFADGLSAKTGEKFLMTGSGSGVFSLCYDMAKANEIHDKIKGFSGFSCITRV